MKISIIIPNFNGEKNLKENLPRVMNVTEHCQYETEVIVVDDASSDDSVATINNLQLTVNRKIKIVRNRTNLGFGRSCNLGVKEAKGDIVVLLNNDVNPKENFLHPLIEHFHDARVFAVGCLEKNVNEKNEVIDEHGAGELFFKNGIFQHRKGDLNSRRTDWVCGGSGAFRRTMFLELGGFDTRFYPFYWEDVDLSYRAKKLGYKLIFEKNAVVYHKHFAGAIAKKYSAAEIEKISFNNQIKFTEKHLSGIKQRFDFYFLLLKHFLRLRKIV